MKKNDFNLLKIPKGRITKLLFIMKISVFLLMVLTFQSFAGEGYSQSTKLSFTMNNSSVEDVLAKIESESEFFFLYSPKLIDVNKVINIDVKSQKIPDVLDQLFVGTDIDYIILDRQIILTSKQLSSKLFKKTYQPVKVTGTVTDASSGEPLPGVNIVVEGTTQGVITDLNGKFSIEIPDENSVLVFSYVGYLAEKVPYNGQTSIDMQMVLEIKELNEIVVVGYGKQKKATVTGSIATVKGDELKQMPATNLSSMLASRMTGVVVNTRSSAPGAEKVEINIRGRGTWQEEGAVPLIIIDGIANRSGFANLNPNDIESISVLKDASAAIYGSRAANGVILVTTKRGKEGKPTIEYTGNFGITRPTRVPAMTRSWQYAKYYTEAQRNGYMWTDEEIEMFKAGTNPNLYPNYDLEDYVLQDAAPQTTHTLSLRGGNSSVKYYVSGRSLYEDSYFKNGIDDFRGYNILSNIDANVTENLTLSASLSGKRNDIRRAVGSGTFDNIDIGFFEEMLGTDPTKPIFYENGLPASIYDHNIVENIEGKAGEKDNRTSIINSQVTTRWQLPFITNGLFVEGTAAYDFSNVKIKEFSKSYDLYSYNNSTGEYLNLNTNPVMNRGLRDYFYNSYRYTLYAKLGYQKTFFEDHSFDGFIAYEQYSINTEEIEATRSTFLSDQIPFQFVGDPTTQKNKGTGTEFAYRNFFGRLAYNYKEKYLLDFTLRRDESPKFPENNRVGWFPGISAGWRISREAFMKERFGFVDNLKLRASYGQMGSDNVDDYQYLATAAIYEPFDSYVFGSDPSVVSTLYFTGTPNPNITWEVANSYNIALEGSLWQSLLGFEAEYFFSKRSNILAPRDASVPVYAGMTLPDENIGKAQNQGFELMLSHRKRLRDFSYEVKGNFTLTANKIIYMDESPNVPDYQRREGHPINSWLLYLTDGIFNTQEEFDATPVKREGARVGDIKYIDANDDGVINDLDKVRLYESSLPKIIYGLNFDFHYKGFDLTMFWQGQADAKTYINPATRNGDINVPLWMYDNRWTPENAEEATMPRAFYHRSESYNTLDSDFWLKDASFLRLRSLELAYNLPKKIISKVSLSNARVYVSGMNLLLFDKIKNYDPEVVNELGVYYPATKVYNIGVNLSF